MYTTISNLHFENYVVLSITVTVIGIGITFYLINSFSEFGNVTRVRQVDTTRVHEGLPTDVALTPEDFIAHPELAEIFDVTDTNTTLNVALESNEHYDEIQDQLAAVDSDNLMTLYQIIEAFLTSFN
jgi:hypothetical protein